MTLRSRITTGSMTLPVCVVLSAIVWGTEGLQDSRVWGGYALCLLLTYGLMELNNRWCLLRVRSRMVSATLLAMLTAIPFLHRAGLHYIPALCLVGSFSLLFASYQKARPEGEVFHAFLLLAVGSLPCPPMVALAVTFYASLLFFLRALTWRSFFAGLFGLALPFVVLALWHFFNGTLPAIPHLLSDASPTLPHLEHWTPAQTVNLSFLGLQTFLGLFHYYRTNFNDKIRVRMNFYTMLLQLLPILAGLAFFPQFSSCLLLLSLTASAPFVAHYWTLARGRGGMTAWFLLNLLTLVALGAYNFGLFSGLAF